VHFKVIIIDNKIAYTGSANLTGAGMGSKSPNRRNFEIGMVTKDRKHISTLMEFYSQVFNGKYCGPCGRRMVCPDPIS